MSGVGLKTPWAQSQPNNFFAHLNKPKSYNLVLCAETEDFDEECERKWQEEGFNTAYVPLLKGGMEFVQRVRATGDGFGVAEYYGIVAFGDAANLILQAHTKPNHPKLCAIIAYYPSTIPSPNITYPFSIHVLVHLAGTEIQVRKHGEVLGIQGKPKTVTKRIDPGAGYGGSLELGFRAYTYGTAEPGFAESDLDEYDAVAEGLAFTRSLNTLRKGFRIDVESEMERTRDLRQGFANAGMVEKVVKETAEYGQVLFGPVLSGGVGHKDLHRFYSDFFIPLPPSFHARLLSRTVGTDRIVDELLVSLTHTQEIPWLLPGVPATGKKVEVVIISIACLRGGKFESEHVYWDQASVLAQVGLLDPKLVPKKLGEMGVEELPVVGAEAARAMRRGGSRGLNDLNPDW